MKRTLALILALLLMLPFAGLAETARPKVGNVYVDGLYPICDEPIELTIAVSTNPVDPYAENHEKKATIVEMEKALNVKINWITIPSDAIAERKAVMLASGDMPDVFGGGWLTDQDIMQNSQLFVQLDELLPQYGKNIIANLEDVTGGDWVNCMTYPDGHIYSIMGGNYKSAVVPRATPWWRQSWLDAVGMTTPTTTEELYNVLKAFKDAKLGGENTIPMDFCAADWASSLSYLFSIYGITAGYADISNHYYTIKDGEVIGWANTQALRDCLEFLNLLVKDGLLNPEGFTQTSEQFNSNLSSGNVGSMISFGTEIADETLAMDYVYQPTAITAPGYEGQFLLATNDSTAYNRNSWTITTACEEPIAALLVWDYLSQNLDFAYSVRYGAPGLIYDKIGDDYVEVNTYVVENFSVEDMKNYYSAEKYPWIYEDLNDATNIVNSQVFQNPPLLRSTLSQPEPKNVTTNRRLFVLYHYNNNEWMQKENMGTAIITPDQQDALDLECDGLVSYIDSFIANSILDGLTDESWEAFQNGLNDYGYDYYIEWHQNYKDGTLNDFI